MNIGGFQKNSMIDFPGTIAGVVFTQGCNFMCPYCHNPDLLTAAAPPDKSGEYAKMDGRCTVEEKEVMGFLAKRKGLLEGVVITGGEPTLQKDLPRFCREIKFLGYRLKLDTNGSRPDVLAGLLDEHLLDYVAMDVKTSLQEYHRVSAQNQIEKAIEQSISLIMAKAPDYEFRSTCLKPFIREGMMPDIARMVNGAKRYILQPCSQDVNVLDVDCLASPDNFYSPEQLEALGKMLEPHVESVLVR